MFQHQPVQSNDTKADPVVTQLSNTVARPGALSTEWWTVLIAGAVSSALAVIGLPGSAAAQVAGIVAPILLALAYAFVRAHTKGALADALEAIFPQAGSAAANPAPQINNGNVTADGRPIVESAIEGADQNG